MRLVPRQAVHWHGVLLRRQTAMCCDVLCSKGGARPEDWWPWSSWAESVRWQKSRCAALVSSCHPLCPPATSVTRESTRRLPGASTFTAAPRMNAAAAVRPALDAQRPTYLNRHVLCLGRQHAHKHGRCAASARRLHCLCPSRHQQNSITLLPAAPACCVRRGSCTHGGGARGLAAPAQLPPAPTYMDHHEPISRSTPQFPSMGGVILAAYSQRRQYECTYLYKPPAQQPQPCILACGLEASKARRAALSMAHPRACGTQG